MVDIIAGHELLSFIEAYSGYNQIPTYGPDQQHISFITYQRLYCYKMMSFMLKNGGATYQRFVNSMFDQQMGKTIEVYVDYVRDFEEVQNKTKP